MSPASEHLAFMRGAALSALPPYRSVFLFQLRELAGLIIQAGCHPCPPPASVDPALSVTAPAVSVQGAGSYSFRLNGHESATSLSRFCSSSVIGRLGLRASRITHASASTVSPAPTDIPSSVAPISIPLWSL